jgi:hypothetical protein
MNPSSILVGVVVLAWFVYRQYQGRFVSARSNLLVPAILLVVGLYEAASAHIAWSTGTLALVGGTMVLTAVLGVVRGWAIRLSVVEGYLYQRGGALSLGLWAVSIGVRVLVEVLAGGTAVAPAMQATLMLSLGVSLAAQAAVLMTRVAADGRPLRPSGDRRPDRARSTLSR